MLLNIFHSSTAHCDISTISWESYELSPFNSCCLIAPPWLNECHHIQMWHQISKNRKVKVNSKVCFRLHVFVFSLQKKHSPKHNLKFNILFSPSTPKLIFFGEKYSDISVPKKGLIFNFFSINKKKVIKKLNVFSNFLCFHTINIYTNLCLCHIVSTLSLY